MWPFGNEPAAPQNGAMGLGQQQSFGQHPQFGQQYGSPYGQQQQQGMMGSFMGGATNGAYNPNQQMVPPSELEMVSMLLHHQKPVDQFLMGPNLNSLISIIANVVNLSMVEFFRNAKFTEDKEGNLAIDVASLPQQYQTLSPENVTAEMTKMQAACNQTVQQSLMEQQQLLAMAQQSSMQGMLEGALADPGVMEKAGGAMGGLVRGVVGLR
tara:strand:+ start:83 stop:715 length:633 start_codon:yes stop_codon:yes gene_type:complete